MKKDIFPHFSRILSLQVRQSKWQISVSGQIFFNRADKNKSNVSVLSAMLYYMSDINVPDNSHE